MNLFKRISFLLIVLSLAFVLSCGIDGDIKNTGRPVIEITSYEGTVDTVSVEDGKRILFQQEIFWNAYVQGGVIEDYAYRVGVKMKNGEIKYLRTAGHDYVIPSPTDYLVDNDENNNKYGWIYHHKDGIDTSIPLNELDDDKKTIWTNERYTKINFPTNVVVDTTGAYTVRDSNIEAHFFEVKAIDNQGLETEVARKYYYVYGTPQAISVQSTKGSFDRDSDGNIKEVGQGITIQFGLLNSIDYVGRVPWYYKFRLKKVGKDFNEISASDWIDTRDLNDGDVSFVTVYTSQIASAPEERKFLSLNYKDDAGESDSYNVIEAFGVDVTGVPSPTVCDTFFVSEKFKPKANFYLKQSYCIGNYHFETGSNNTEIEVPTMQTSLGLVYGAQFYTNKDGDFAALYDSRFKVQVKWGYYGEYLDNDPSKKRSAVVLDSETGENYLSDIVYYDLRLNNEFYYYYPLVNAPGENHIVEDMDENGILKRWLRVPVGSTIAQKTLLGANSLKYVPSNVSLTEENKKDYINSFELRVVDLQGIASEPDSLNFYLYEPKLPEDREGILILDDYPNGGPSSAIGDRYDKMVVDLGNKYGKVDIIDLETLFNYLDPAFKVTLSPTDLNPYKLVIFASDNYLNSRMLRESLAIRSYIRVGGNVVFSTGSSIASTFSDFKAKTNNFMSYFGLNHQNNYFDIMGSGYINNPYLIGVVGKEGYPDMDVDVEESSIPQVNIYGGYGPLAYFNEDESKLLSTAKVLYRSKIKPVNLDPEAVAPTDQETFDEYNNKIIGLVNDSSRLNMMGVNSKQYLLTVPLSFMEKDDMYSFIDKVWAEL